MGHIFTNSLLYYVNDPLYVCTYSEYMPLRQSSTNMGASFKITLRDTTPQHQPQRNDV